MRKQRQAVPANLRLGAVIVVAAFLMVGILAFAAFSIDVGYICLVKAQAQNAADSAALAGGQVLVSEDRLRGYFDDVYAEARTISGQYGNLHKVGPHTSLLQPSDDVVIGRLENPDANMSFSDPATYNALVVTVKATKDRNHDSPLFLASVLGFQDFDVTATATVAYADRIAGFKPTTEHPTTSLLPITLQIDSWKSQLASRSSDVWTYNDNGTVTPGPDGIPEIRLYPISSGSGNWGTVDIGNNNNSTSDLERQIRDGVNQTDLAPYGGKFTINTSADVDTGSESLLLNGDTGVSAGMKDALASIKGEPRTIPLYKSFDGGGNNIEYEIVGFAGIRIMEVQLSSGDKYVIVQPAYVVDETVVTENGSSDTYFVTQPMRMIR